ncbi:TetR-like C-terminal domain-containing protein [Paracoccus limosus]|uniref:TetR-like C-terminal domain-containing protein n=1 Tax=Paracoccus limosus TaxID=913252 RepID=UPI001B86FA6D
MEASTAAYLRFATGNPGLYRLMFSADAGEPADVHLDERALATCQPLIELLERGQAEGVLRQRDIDGQMAACWGLTHGLALLTIDGILLPEKSAPMRSTTLLQRSWRVWPACRCWEA